MPRSITMRFMPLTINEFINQFNITTAVMSSYAEYLRVNAYQHHYGNEETTRMMWYVQAVYTHQTRD